MQRAGNAVSRICPSAKSGRVSNVWRCLSYGKGFAEWSNALEAVWRPTVIGAWTQWSAISQPSSFAGVLRRYSGEARGGARFPTTRAPCCYRGRNGTTKQISAQSAWP